MRQFSIRTRMAGAIGVVLLLLVLVGGAGLWGMSRLHALSNEFMNHAFKETVTLSQLQESLGDLGRYEKDMIIGYEKPEAVAKAKAQWLAARDTARQQIDQMLVGEEDEDNALVREMKDQLAKYVAFVEPVSAQLESGGYDTATVANRVLARAHEQYDGLIQNLGKVEAVLIAEAAQLEQEGQATRGQTLTLFGLAVALAAVVVVPSTLLNMQSICRPVEDAQRLAGAIARGDLTQPVPSKGRDEPGRAHEGAGRDADLAGRHRGAGAQLDRQHRHRECPDRQRQPGFVQPHRAGRQQSAADRGQHGAAHQHGAPERRCGAPGHADGGRQRRSGGTRWAGGEPGGHHHGRDQPEQPEDRRHHRRDRWHCVPDQHPGAERRGGSGAGWRAGPGVRRGGGRGAQPRAAQCAGGQGNQGPDRGQRGQGGKRHASGGAGRQHHRRDRGQRAEGFGLHWRHHHSRHRAVAGHRAR